MWDFQDYSVSVSSKPVWRYFALLMKIETTREKS